LFKNKENIMNTTTQIENKENPFFYGCDFETALTVSAHSLNTISLALEMLRSGNDEGPCSQKDYKNAVCHSIQDGVREAEKIHKIFQDGIMQWVVKTPADHLDELKKRLFDQKKEVQRLEIEISSLAETDKIPF
jgi:hypothetical protein